MQIRLTVTLGPRGSGQGAGGTVGAPGAGPACDVVVTAPSGTPLSAVTGALVSTATAAAGSPAQGGGADAAVSPASSSSHPDSSAAVYVGTERLDPHRQTLGAPPLVDGAVVSLHGPALPASAPALASYGSAKARLHVTAGPDAGGIHLLQGGRIELGRSAGTDVPLDDPDVSRLHCAVTVSDGGDVTVTDLGSTNGTSLDGSPVGRQPVLFRPGSTLRVGESALRVETSPPGEAPGSDAVRAAVPDSLPTQPDGNGQLRLVAPQDGPAGGSASARARTGMRTTAPAPRASDSSHGYAESAQFPDDVTTHSAGLAQHARYAEQFPPVPPQAQQPYGQSQTAGAPEAKESERPRGTRGLSAWARRFTGARAAEGAPPESAAAAGTPSGADAGQTGWGEECGPDPATVLLTALGPGPRLWEREPGHPDALTVRIGTAHGGGGGRPGGPITVDLREAGALGLAGPRPRLMGLARSVVAQLAALHGPSTLEIVLLSTDRSRASGQRTAEWAWLGWLPHLRPVHGQDCRLLTAYDRDQATARTAELTRRLEEDLQQRAAYSPDSAGSAGVPGAAGTASGPHTPQRVGSPGPFTLLVVDGDPGSATLRETVSRLAADGPRAGIHLLCLAETPAATPSSPLSETVEAACNASTAFRECGALALLSGAVATAVRVVRRGAASQGGAGGALTAGGTVGTIDAVSAAWAERFARAMAPLREPDGTAVRTGTAARPSVTLPRTSRLLDELGLARATPAALLARWAEPAEPSAGRAALVFGAGPHGPLEAELTSSQGHALIVGQPGSGKTELLRSLAASLSAGGRPDRLQLVLLDGDGATAREGLGSCLELPHARHHLAANDPVRMREFAQSLSGELKRRTELFGAEGTYEEYARGAGRPGHGAPAPRQSSDRGRVEAVERAERSEPQQTAGVSEGEPVGAHGTLRLRTAQAQAGTQQAQQSQTQAQAQAVTSSSASPSATVSSAGPEGEPAGGNHGDTNSTVSVQHLDTKGASFPRMVILVDDFDTLVDPALGNPGRPAAGSVVRALEAVARDGARLGVHVVAATGRPDRTAATAVAQAAALRAELAWAGDGDGEEDLIPGRAVLTGSDGTVAAFQAGRVTGRIPRTSTQRPTVVPLDWTRAGDPPASRPVRELGNGPTDLALLASAVSRAARSLGLEPQESGTPAANRSRSGQDEVLES